MVALQDLITTLSGGFGANPITQSWLMAAGIALATSITILAFIYILGNFFKNPGLSNYVKFEIYELFVTIFLVLILGALINEMATIQAGVIFPAYSGQPDGMYKATEAYFIGASRIISGIMDTNYAANIIVDHAASTTPYARPMGVGLVATPFAGLASPIKQLLYNVLTSLSIGYLVNQAQLYVFQFAVYGFLKYFLPIGIFLRCFLPTRRLGGTIIAIGCGFLFFFPFLILIANEIVTAPGALFSTFGQQLNLAWQQGFIKIGDTSVCTDNNGQPLPCNARTDFNDLTFGGILKNKAGNVFDYVGNAIKIIPGYALSSLFLIPIAQVGLVFALGFLFPALNTLLLVEFVKSTSAIIGEEVDVSSLTRLI